MNDTFTIRQAALDDIPIIVSHRRKMFEDMRSGTPEILDRMEARFVDWVRERMESERYFTWFAVSPVGEVISGAGLWLMTGRRMSSEKSPIGAISSMSTPNPLTAVKD
jgi:cytochrome c-type biogenesis protein CcmH/NrfF